MQTNFTLAQLADPAIAHSEAILRKCVHCGFCTATCPTYLTLGDELDSPRGRIYLIKDMFENDRAADEKTMTHIDRCLSCLSCMTTCPSGVDYMHLVDHARAHIHSTRKRPLMDRIIRNVLALTLPYPGRFRQSLRLAKLGQPFSKAMGWFPALKPFKAMLNLAPSRIPATAQLPSQSNSTEYIRKVGILPGCAQQVLDPDINRATTQLLNRLGVGVILSGKEKCCGSLVHHMGREKEALDFAKANIDNWYPLIASEEIEAIIITASGCGTTLKDYGHMLRLDAEYAEKAKVVSDRCLDIVEYLDQLEIPNPGKVEIKKVTYHSACSMQHGQKITGLPKKLLSQCGFEVSEPAEGHLCCGSAGIYNIMQSDIAKKLKLRKLKNLGKTSPEVIATGNIGCMTQLSGDAPVPIVHTVELLNWALGGEKPAKLQSAK